MSLTLSKCCWFVDLRTACFIIGYFNLTAEIIAITLSFVGIFTGTMFIEIFDEEAYIVGGAVIAASIIFMLIMLISLVFTSLLLAGVHQRNRGFVKAYLIFVTILLALGIIVWFARFAFPNLSAVNVIGSLMSLMWAAYSLTVVRSYYYKIADPIRIPLQEVA